MLGAKGEAAGFGVVQRWASPLPSGPTGVNHYYDANGNLTTDTINTYSWDADGNNVSANLLSITYDAFDRAVEQNNAGTYKQILYSPIGKVALMNKQTATNVFIPLPGGEQATYTNSTIRFRHSDWLASARFESNMNELEYGDTAYAPFGEPYSTSNTAPYFSFTGQNQDTVSGLYDFLYREHSPAQGRWLSPDPTGLAAVDFSDPQSFNRYAYVENMPDSAIDPLGLRCTIYVLGVGNNQGQYSNFLPGSATAYPFSDLGLVGGVLSAFGGGTSSQGVSSLIQQYQSEGVDLVGFSGGAQVISNAIYENPTLATGVLSTTYISPGLGYFGGADLFEARNSQSFRGSGLKDFLATSAASSAGVELTPIAGSPGHNFVKEFGSSEVQGRLNSLKSLPCGTGGPAGQTSASASGEVNGEWSSFTSAIWGNDPSQDGMWTILGYETVNWYSGASGWTTFIRHR